MQEASTRWAGVTEPIVPVSAEGRVEDSAQRMVAQARVDGLVNVDLTESKAASAASDLSLPWVPLSQIDSTGPLLPGWFL